MALVASRPRAPIGVYEQTVAPAAEPVTLADVKEHARIDGSADDTYLTALITAAREMVERDTGRCLITQTWRLTLDDWPGGGDLWWDGVREGPITMLRNAPWVELRKAPIAGITSVVTLDESDTPTTWAASNYYLAKLQNGYGRLTRKQGATWPSVVSRDAGAIQITFTAGYGAAGTAVPMALRQAVKSLVGHWYEHREPAGECASATVMPMGLGSILASYRVAR